MRRYLYFLLLVFPTLSHAQVKSVTPQGQVQDVSQVVIQFSSPQISLGNVQNNLPAKSSCFKGGTGRWVDTTTWAYEFSKPLSGGVKCDVQIGKEKFQFVTSAPNIQQTFPPTYRSIEPDQNFILISNGTFDKSSVQKNAYFVIEGVGDRIPVEVLQGYTANGIIKSAKEEFKYDDEAFKGDLLVLRSKRPFPNGKKVSLVWPKVIASESGVAGINDNQLDFTVVDEFLAKINCEREKPQSDCIPLSDIALSLSSSIRLSDAKKVYISQIGTNNISYAELTQLSEKDVVSYLNFKGPFKTNAEYELVIPSNLKDIDGRILVNRSQFPLKVKTSDFPPLLKFPSNFGIIESISPVMPLTRRHIESDAGLQMFGSSGSFNEKNFQTILEVLNQIYRSSDSSEENEVLKKYLTQKVNLKVPRSPEKTEVVGIPLKSTGFYAFEMQSPRLGEALTGESKTYYVRSSALVTDKVAHIKYSDNEVWVWVTQLQTGKPLAQQQVQLVDVFGKKLAQGMTNAKGIAYFSLKSPISEMVKNPEGYFYSGFFAVVADSKSFSFTYSGWDQGLEPWRYQIGYSFMPMPYIGHTVLDRTLFKPEEKISLKTYFRKISNNQLGLPSKSEWPDKIILSHESGLSKYTLPAVWNQKNGISLNEYALPSDIRTGKWSIQLLKKDDVLATSAEFNVENYELPAIQLKLEMSSLKLLPKSGIEVGIQADYLSGGAAKNLEVTLNWNVEAGYFSPKDSDLSDFSFANGRPLEGVHSGGENAYSKGTNQSGKTQLKLNDVGYAKSNLASIKFADGIQNLSVEAVYKDPNGKVQSQLKTAQLWPSNIIAGIKTNAWQSSKDKIDFTVVALDLEQKPLAKVPVEVELYSSAYYSHRKRLVGGFYSYEDFREIKKVSGFCRGATDAKGFLQCSGASPFIGNLIAVAKLTDKEGRISYANVDLWVSDGSNKQWFSGEDSDRADLVALKKSYEPGETAELQLRTPFTHSHVLVTVESDRVLWSEVIEVRGEKPILRVPVKAEYAPGVVVSAFAVRGRIKDAPISGLVDLAKPSFRLGMTQLKVGIQSAEVKIAVTTPKKEFQVRDTVTAQVKLHLPDGSPLSDADLAVVVVDEALLSLKSNKTWALLESMMRPRSYDIKTATAQGFVVGKRHFGVKAVPAGGDGGGDTRRELFDSLVYWNPSVKVDKEGIANVQFQLNDSNSSFRIVAIASSGLQRFGTGWASIRATQDLSVTPAISIYSRQGDVAQVGGTIRNLQAPAGEYIASLIVNGIAQEKKKVELKKGDHHFVSWKIKSDKIGENIFDLQIQDLNGKIFDSIRKVQKVLPKQSGVENQVEIGLWPHFQKVKIAGEGSSSAKLQVEASSQFEKIQAREKFDFISSTSLESKISEAVSDQNHIAFKKVAQNISKYLDKNGLLKYFDSDSLDGDVALTAYVLSIAKAAGWATEQSDQAKMLEALNSFVFGRLKVSGERGDLNILKALAVATLAEYGEFNDQMLSVLSLDYERWPSAVLVDWHHLLGSQKGLTDAAASRVRIAQILQGRSFLSGARVQVKETPFDFIPWLLISPRLALVKSAYYADSTLLSDKDKIKVINAAKEASPDMLSYEYAWLKLLLKRTSEAQTLVTGDLVLSYAGSEKKHSWKTGSLWKTQWNILEQDSDLLLSQKGKGSPWFKVSVLGKKTDKSIQAGFKIERKVLPLEQRRKGLWSTGDLYRVEIKVSASAEQYWVVVQDSVPAGGSVVQTEGAYLIENPLGQIQFYLPYFAQGERTLSYTVRLNMAGTYLLDGLMAKALYNPDVYSYLPLKDVTIEE